MDRKLKKALQNMQNAEMTEYYIYSNLAKKVKSKEDAEILQRIADEEYAHAKIWEGYTKEQSKPNKAKIGWYTFLATVLGYTFVLKKMEQGEDNAQKTYDLLFANYPEAKTIMEEEKSHEEELLNMLDEEKLQYVGAMVLGLNDALVELSGTLAGLTFATAQSSFVALSGLITGIAATLSMSCSNYLAEKADGNKNALKSSIYTGLAYLITVALMVIPYLLLDNVYVALGVMLAIVVLIILVFNYYISVAKNLPFKKRFLEMVVISLSVAAISFVIGLLVKRFLGIDV